MYRSGHLSASRGVVGTRNSEVASEMVIFQFSKSRCRCVPSAYMDVIESYWHRTIQISSRLVLIHGIIAAHSQLLHDRCFCGRSCESTCGLDHSYLSGMMQKAYAADSGLYKQHIDPLRSDYSRQSRLSVGAVLVPCEKDFVRRNPGEVGGPRRVLVRG